MTASDMIQLAIAIPAGAGLLWAIAVGGIKLGVILKEVTPNGGESLKDRIIKLEETVCLLAKNDRRKMRRLRALTRKTDDQTVILNQLKTQSDKSEKWGNRQEKILDEQQRSSGTG